MDLRKLSSTRLGDRALNVMQLRRLSPRTQDAYVHWMRRYYEFNGRRHPRDLGPEHVTAFLSDLAIRQRVAASTQNQALSALLFLYRAVLEMDLPWLDDVVHAKRPQRLPIVLTREEAALCLGLAEGVAENLGQDAPDAG